MSTAEAELCAAALGWQVTEGVRYLLSTLQIYPTNVEVMIDNQAALTAASLGATWRTRYYAVRARRLFEEGQQGRAVLKHCPTKQMVADALTKLATPDVLQLLIDAMGGRLPTVTVAHTTSVILGPQNRGDIAGDGPDRDDLRHRRPRDRIPKGCKPWNVPGTGIVRGRIGANVIQVNWTPLSSSTDSFLLITTARSSSSPTRGPAGRGRASTLPAWMTQAPSSPPRGPAGRGRA